MDRQGKASRLVIIARFLLLISVGAVLLAAPVVNNYRKRAVLVQFVKPSAESALFGETGEAIGSPQMIVSAIPNEAVITPGDLRAGEPTVVNLAYLEKNAIYPLQLQTVEFIVRRVSQAATALAVLSLIFLMAYRFIKRRRLGVNPMMT